MTKKVDDFSYFEELMDDFTSAFKLMNILIKRLPKMAKRLLEVNVTVPIITLP